MTVRAREALADCEHALADFAVSAGTPFHRSRWVAVVTLLRTVGYALKNIDHEAADAETRQRMDAEWKRLKDSAPEPRIFWEFIDAERNDVVHLYEIRTGVDITMNPVPEPLGYFLMMDDDDSGFGWNPTTYEVVMRRGPFAGRDPLDLCREAIGFWRDYLNAIDRRTVP
jgi:hypothetical protein